jgi:uncharacterized membrane protein
MKTIDQVNPQLRDEALKLLDRIIDKDGQILQAELTKAKLVMENLEASLH